MGGLILLNCSLIALQATELNKKRDGVYNGFEHIFVFCFLVEWILRMMSSGWVWLCSFFNLCDSFLVIGTGVITMWILQPAGVELGLFRKLTALRILRLVRVARAVRFMTWAKEMWLLLRGLIESFRTLLWTLIIVITVLYVFAIASVELIGKHSDFIDDPYVQERFGTLVDAMFTLFQVMTLDTWADSIVRPLMEKQTLLALYFIFFVTVSVFVLMNLITAVIVENAFSIAKDDEQMAAKQVETKNQKEIQSLARMFIDLDEDQSGELNIYEFRRALSIPKFLNKLKLLDMQPHECMEVWDLLDDGDGLLTVEEFTNGLRRMKGGARSKDILDMLKRLRTSLSQAEALQHDVECLGDSMEDLQQEIGDLSNDLSIVSEVCQVLTEAFGVPAKKKKRPKEAAQASPEKAAKGPLPNVR